MSEIDWYDCAAALRMSGLKGADWSCKPEVAAGLAARLRRLDEAERLLREFDDSNMPGPSKGWERDLNEWLAFNGRGEHE